MELKKLKHCLSLLITFLLVCLSPISLLAQTASNDAGTAAVSGGIKSSRPSANDAVSVITSRVASESFDRVWQMTGPFGGDVTVMTIDPKNADRILIGTSDGQIYGSSDGGTIWKRFRPGIRANGFIVTVIQFDRERAGVIYAGVKPQIEIGDETSGGGFFISEDDGESWREVETMRGRAVRSFSQSANNPNVLAIAASNGVYRSSDRGNKWEMITYAGDPELRGFHSVAIDPRDANAIYVGTHHLPWKTTDGGANWKRTGHKDVGMIDDSDIFTIQIDPDNPNTVMMSACSGIYRSQDAGNAWTKFQGIPYSSRRTHMIYRHPTRPATIFAGTTEGLWISTSDGKPDTWRQVTSANLVINAISIHPSQPDRVFLGTQDNGVLISLDGGETYEASNAGFINRKVPAVLADGKQPGRIYAGVLFDGLNGGLFISEDGGITWQQSVNGMGVRDVYSLYQSPTRPETIYAGTNHGVFRSDDNGRNWTQVKREEPVVSNQKNNGNSVGQKKDSTVKANDSKTAKANSAQTNGRPRVVVNNHARSKTSSKPRPTAAKTAGRKTKKTAVVSIKKPEPPKPQPSDRIDLQSQVFALVPLNARIDQAVENSDGSGDVADQPNRDWLIASTWDGLFFTDDEKKGWKELKIRPAVESDIAPPIQPRVNSIATTPLLPGVILLGTEEGLFVSTDNGGSFRLTPIIVEEEVKRVRSVIFDPRSPSIIYLGATNGFFRSLDGGKSWEHRGGGMPQLVNVGALMVNRVNHDELYLYDDLRNTVYQSKDKGWSWDRLDISQLPSLKMLAITGDPFDTNRIYAGSNSGGVYVMSRK